MIPMLNSLMYPGGRKERNKLVIIQNMRSEKTQATTTDTALNDTIQKGVTLTLQFSDSINPMSLTSAEEIRRGSMRKSTNDLHSKKGPLQFRTSYINLNSTTMDIKKFSYVALTKLQIFQSLLILILKGTGLHLTITTIESLLMLLC